jgi:hypothetical protein
MAEADKTLTVLGWFVLITLMCAIARQLSEQVQLNLTPSSYGASWNRPGSSHRLLERFENASDVISGKPDEDQFRPADAKASYSLLTDVLAKKQEAGTLTAKTCFQKDFLAQTEKTGNFIQRTNNYRHAAPDNCTAPLTEFVDSFYKNP